MALWEAFTPGPYSRRPDAGAIRPSAPFAHGLVSCWLGRGLAERGFGNRALSSFWLPMGIVNSAGAASGNVMSQGALGEGFLGLGTLGLNRQWDSTAGERSVPFDPGGQGGHQPFTIAVIAENRLLSGVQIIYAHREALSTGALISIYYSGTRLQFDVRGVTTAATMQLTVGLTPGVSDRWACILTTRGVADHEMQIVNLSSGVWSQLTSSTNVGSAGSGARVMQEAIGCQFNTSTTYQSFGQNLVYAALSWDRGMTSQEMFGWLANPLGFIEPAAYRRIRSSTAPGAGVYGGFDDIFPILTE